MSKNQSTESVKVMVRVRPMNKKEQGLGCKSIVRVDKKLNQIELVKVNEDDGSKDFAFDAVYDIDSQQQTVYDESAFPLVESVIQGYNGTIFAYGQTGCGKTHTMLGVPNDPELRGIIPNCFAHIFGFIDEESSGTKFLVRCSYLEIYNEEVHDLLIDPHHGFNQQQRKLDLKEDPQKGVFVKDLTCLIVKSIPEIEKAMNFGTNNRKTAATDMNKDSSRSHSLFTIYIETAEDQNGEQRIKAGKLNLVDLAGSERSSKTGAVGQTLKEGIKINLSLTALGNVISALVDGKSSHIPYRDSKLTRLLQDSLGGNTKTVMIAACSPADYNYEETLSTLRYAARAKAIKNKPKVNEDPKDALLKQYEEEIKKLKQMLDSMNKGKPLQNPVESLEKWEKLNSMKMDLHGSMNANDFFDKAEKNKKNNTQQEESVEELIKKLSEKGTKVKVIKEGDESGQQTPIKQHKDGYHKGKSDLNEDRLQQTPLKPPIGTGKQKPSQEKKTEQQSNNKDKQGKSVAFSEEEDSNKQVKGKINQKADQKKDKKGKQTLSEEEDNEFNSTTKDKKKQNLSEEDDDNGMQIISKKSNQKLNQIANKENKLPRRTSNDNEENDMEEVLKKAEELKQAKIKENEHLHNELMSKEAALEGEKKQKEELAKLIQEMEKKLVHGGHGMDDLNEENKNRIRKERMLQKQLKKQKIKEKELMEEKRKKEEEMLFVHGNYTSLQQEVESMREIMDKLRQKYKNSQSEIKDLTNEFQTQKTELLDIIRSQERAVKFSNKVMTILLSDNELYKLHQRAKWDEEKGEWTIPQFTFNPKSKDIQFPSINAKQRVDQLKDERDIIFDQDKSDPDTSKNNSSEAQFRKNGNFQTTQQAYNPKSTKPNKKENSTLHNLSQGDSSVDNNWLEDGHQSAENSSQLRDSSNGVPSRKSNMKGKPEQNQIIPERRRKYLNSNVEEYVTNSNAKTNASIGQQMMGVENHELYEDGKGLPKKNNKKNVQLQPLDHNPQARNSSVPPVGNSSHPLKYAPSPATRGGNNVRLESIDHAAHLVTEDVPHKLPSPTQGKRKQLEPLK